MQCAKWKIAAHRGRPPHLFTQCQATNGATVNSGSIVLEEVYSSNSPVRVVRTYEYDNMYFFSPSLFCFFHILVV